MPVKTLNQLAREELNNVRIAIIGSQTSLGLRDSGVSANSFTITGSRTQGAVLEGAEYIQTNYDKVGRKPGGSGGGLIEGLMNWGKLEVRDGESRRQAAFRAGRVIHERGTLIFRGKKGINIDLILENSADRFEVAVADNEQQRAIDELNSVIP